MMLSRVAEALYWLGRQVERAENTARIVGVNGNLLLDLPPGIVLGWAPLVAISGSQELFESLYEGYDERSVVRFLIGNRRHPGSVVSSLTLARDNCRTIRDIVPREVWEFINEYHHYATDNLTSGLSKRGRYAYITGIIRRAQTLTGALGGTMNHDAGHEFLRLGRNLERGDMTTRIVDVRSETLLPEETTGLRPFENIQWIGVLKSLTAYQMYRRRVQARVRRLDALHFLICDEQFPRTYYHCAAQVDDSLVRLPRNDDARRVAARSMRLAQSADFPVLAESNQALHEFIDQLQLVFAELHEAIATAYFSREEVPGTAG